MAEITIETRTPTGVSGSGPFYDVTFSTNYSSHIRVNDWAYVDLYQCRWSPQPGPLLSEYKYQVTALVDADTLTLKWISATNGYPDDEPYPMHNGFSASYDNCNGISDVVFKREIGEGNTFLMFVDY